MRIPGFWFDPRRHRARFEVILPGTGAGKRRRKTVRVETRDQALAIWKAWRAKVLEGRALGGTTLSAYQQEIWPKVLKRVADKTARHDSWALEKALLPSLGGHELGRINDAVVRDLVADLRSRYAPASINGIISVMRKILRDAVDRELLDAVPVRKFPREKEVLLRLEFSDEERARFIGAFDDEEGFRRLIRESRRIGEPVTSKFFGRARRFGGGRLAEGVAAALDYQRFRASKPLFVVALETGLSRSDVLSLRWSSVNLRDGWIRVPRSKTKVEATIPISEACREALAECRGRPVVSEIVFLTPNGRPYSVSTVVRFFRKAKQLGGITRRFRFHDLRHSFASLLASKGVSIQVIAKALGHSSSSMAERYARPNEEAMKSILTALDSTRTEVLARASKPDGHPKKSNSFSNSAGDTGGAERV